MINNMYKQEHFGDSPIITNIVILNGKIKSCNKKSILIYRCQLSGTITFNEDGTISFGDMMDNKKEYSYLASATPSPPLRGCSSVGHIDD